MPTCQMQLLHESRYNLWRDWFDMAQWPPAWRTGHSPAPRVALMYMTRLIHKSRRSDWRDSNGPDLENMFWSHHFSNFDSKWSK
jgi:hypothetical protein